VIIIRSSLLYRLFGKSKVAGTSKFQQAHFGSAAKAEPPTERDTIVDDYANAIGLISAANRHSPIWWATDLASRNRFASPMATLINDLVRFRAADEKAQKTGTELILNQPPWPLVAAAKELAQSRDEAVRVFAWPGSLQVARIRGKTRSWASLIKSAVFSLIQVRAAKKTYGSFPKTESPVFLIKSFVYANDFDDTGQYRDAFFGRFPDFAATRLEHSAKVLTVVQGFERKDECYRRMRQLTDQWLVPIESYLTLRDVIVGFLKCVRALVRHRISIPDQLKIIGLNTAPMIRETIAAGGWHLAFFQYLHEIAAINMTRAHQLVGCALTFEANPWERMFLLGLRRENPTLPIYGFQHSVVPQAAVGMFLNEHEIDCAPGPDAILTTGKIPAEIIARYGAYPTSQIWPAGALRYENLAALMPAPRPIKNASRTVLVALEGVYPAAALLEFAINQARATPDILFCIRAHPVLPLPELLKGLPPQEQRLPANVIESHDRSVLQDVVDSDLTLYWGSTIALEAILMGRPIVHFDRGDALSYDPLFELPTFHWTVHSAKNLNNIVQLIADMTLLEYETQREDAIKYVKEYFLPVDDSAMSKTLPETHQ
jgi:hypothetical protein